jgi:hypothetical protein
MCLNLSLTLQAQGDEAGAKAAKNKACKLGLASACGN